MCVYGKLYVDRISLLLSGDFEAASEHVPKRIARVNNALNASTEKTALILNSLEDSEYISARMKHARPWKSRLRSESNFQNVEEESMQRAFLTSLHSMSESKRDLTAGNREQGSLLLQQHSAKATPAGSPRGEGQQQLEQQQENQDGDKTDSNTGERVQKKTRKFEGEGMESDEAKIMRELPPLVRER